MTSFDPGGEKKKWFFLVTRKKETTKMSNSQTRPFCGLPGNCWGGVYTWLPALSLLSFFS